MGLKHNTIRSIWNLVEEVIKSAADHYLSSVRLKYVTRLPCNATRISKLRHNYEYAMIFRVNCPKAPFGFETLAERSRKLHTN